jgi:hypothetical protein
MNPPNAVSRASNALRLVRDDIEVRVRRLLDELGINVVD